MPAPASDTQPLVSFIVLFYNQRRFVRGAVENAFAQTYQPIEFLFSDDHSEDGTYEELERAVADLASGRKVQLNRNARNLGVAGHVNRAVKLASGRLLVFMAGDDLSLPERVAVLVKAWQSEGCRADLLHSNVMRMSEDGRDLCTTKPDQEIRGPATLETMIRMNAHVYGAACTRAPFDRFEPIADDVAADDMILPIRAALLGGLQYVDQPLNRHRVGGISGDFDPDPETSHDLLFGRKVKWARWLRDANRQRLKDLRQYPERAGEAALRLCEIEYRRWKTVVDLAEASWPRRWAIGLGVLANHPASFKWRLKTVLPYLFPAVYAPFYAWRRRQRHRRSTNPS